MNYVKNTLSNEIQQVKNGQKIGNKCNVQVHQLKNVEESSSRSWACNAALTSTSKLDSDASKSTRVVQDFGVTMGETEEPDSVGQSSMVFSDKSKYSVQRTLPERHWQSS